MKIATYLPIIVALLMSGAAWGQEGAAPPASEELPAEETQPVAKDRVTVQTITSYLDRMNYVYKLDKSVKVPEIELLMRGDNGNYQLRIFIDDPRKVVYMCINRLMTIPDSHPRKSAVLQRLMELNWELLIGKYEWDKSDGEARLSYTFSTENGLGYEAFVACFQLLVLTADRDYPKLMRLMWAPEEKPAEPLAAGKPEESAKEKVTAPKEEPPAKEETPAKEEALSKPEAPAKAGTPPKEEAPAKEETLSQPEAPTQEEVVPKQEAPSTEAPAQEETSGSVEESELA